MRGRKPITILATIMAWLLVASTALAAVTIEGTNVYANGHSIVIDSDSEGRTRVSSSEDGAVSEDVGSRDITGYNIYGGSHSEGKDAKGFSDGKSDSDTVNGTSITINGGTVGNVYGGGHAEGGDGSLLGGDGGDANASVNGNTNIVINGGTVNGNVYGGGRAEDGSNSIGSGGHATANVNGNTNVTVNGGTIKGNVYGGGDEGNVTGGTNVNVTDATVNGDVYGGGAEGNVTGSTNVNVTDATVNGNVYGGGAEGSTGSTSVNVTGSSVKKSVYGGGDEGKVNGSTSINVTGSTVGGSVYGGSRDNDVSGNTSVNVKNGSSVNGSVYGGGGDGRPFQDSSVGGSTSVTVDNSTVKGNVYGGSEDGNVSGTTTVNIQNGAKTGKVYGGSKTGDTGKSNITITGDDVVTDTIFAGADDSGTTSGSNITLNGGTVTSKRVFAWGGNDASTRVTGNVAINICQLSARRYTFYLPWSINANSAIIRTGDLQWDGIIKVNDLCLPYVYYVYQLTQPAAKQISVVTAFRNGSQTVATVNSSVTVAPGATVMVSPASTFDGAENYDIGTLPAAKQVNYGTVSPVTFEVPVTPKAKEGTVTFHYVYNGVIHHTDVKTGTVTYGGGSITLKSSWSGNENVDGGSGSGEVSYEKPTAVVEVTVKPKSKTGTVTFQYVYNGVIHYTDVKTATVTYGADPITLESSWGGNENVGGGSGSGTVSFAEPTEVVEITVAPKTKEGAVTFQYVYNGVIHHTDVKTATVTYGVGSITLESSWGGNENVGGGSGSGTVSFAEPTKVVEITVAPKTKEGKVTFQYVYNGVIHHTDVQTGTVTYGEGSITLESKWDGNSRVYGGEGSGTVSFEDPTDEVTITVEPRSLGITVRFIYLYGSTTVSTDEQSVDLTYGDPAKTVTPAPFSVPGYYLLAPVSPVTVTFDSMLELEDEVLEIRVEVGRVADDDDGDQQIPLGPSATQMAIPLGLGVPSTGDSTGISILLMAMGVAVVVIVASKAKRSSAK